MAKTEIQFLQVASKHVSIYLLIKKTSTSQLQHHSYVINYPYLWTVAY